MMIFNKALRIEDFDPVVEKVAGRVKPLQGRLNASAGRLVLVNDCLTNIPMFTWVFTFYMMGCMKKWTGFDLDSFGRK